MGAFVNHSRSRDWTPINSATLRNPRGFANTVASSPLQRSSSASGAFGGGMGSKPAGFAIDPRTSSWGSANPPGIATHALNLRERNGAIDRTDKEDDIDDL